MAKVTWVQIGENVYRASDGSVICREWGLTPNGLPLNGAWVYRDSDGALITWNQYRNDIFEHYHIVISPSTLKVIGKNV